VRTNRLGQVGVPAAIVCIVVMMVVPLPTVLLDLLLVCNLALAVLVLLSSMYVTKALDFSAFPSLLLIATMFRLALNVSCTRLVLLHGHAGKVIDAFGHVVIGGSVVVGLVIFLILVVIQFVVITNGAGRVAEVGARFTLDAMPGKQMAIDADLNSGVITDEQARKRRREVAAEADFYGAMDGASKFVKGDAIAAIIITMVNLLGGFIVGVVQQGIPISEAVTKYSVLSVGDGLVSQIPALLISIASGLIVTRSATESDMGTDLVSQFGRQSRAMRVGAFVVGGIAILPGMPKVPFLAIGGLLWFAAGRADRMDLTPEEERPTEADLTPPDPDAPETLLADLHVEPLQLEVAFGLMDLVDPGRGGDLLDRVKSLRRKLALELGIVVPPVRTRDNAELPPSGYAIRVHGVEVARGEAPAGSVLVLGDPPEGMPGERTHDPVFGMDATWVPRELGPQAELAGCTVVDRASVVTAHLAEVVRANAGRLLSREDVQQLVEATRGLAPSVVDELGGTVTMGEVQRVLANLLDEGVAIRDLVRILEVLTERGRVTKDPEALTESVRAALGPAIAARHARDGRLCVVTIDPLTEHALLPALTSGDSGTFLNLDPDLTQQLVTQVGEVIRIAGEQGIRPVLVCGAALRSAVRRLVRNIDPSLPVLAYGELGTGLELEMMGVIDLAPAAV
jgi:flagellar biosynthesis protein FlhA